MLDAPQQSLRRHRQTLLPPQNEQQHKLSSKSSNPQYDVLLGPNSAELPSVQQKDKEKIGNLVRSRLSTRFPVNYTQQGQIPPLPLENNDIHSLDNLQLGDVSQAPPNKYGQIPTGSGLENISSMSNYKPQMNSSQAASSPLNGPANIITSAPIQRAVDSSTDHFQDTKISGTQLDGQIAALRNANFNAKSFISTQLASATDVEISEFTEKLIRLQDQVAIDRKDMVYGNYKTFLAVGTQISVLSSELQVLRKLINDVHVATTAMKQDAENTLALNNPDSVAGNHSGNGSFSSLSNNSSTNLLNPINPRIANLASTTRQNNRNSVLVLESMWAQDLSGLLRTVEGAQKYLPPIPGRHVVEEGTGWDQLNAATWKPWQPVKVYLLNDYLLIAVKKRSRNGDILSVQQSQSLVADQCWPLSDIQIKDLRYIEQTPNAPPSGFAVQKDGSIYVYKHSDPNVAARFLNSYNKLEKDLRKGNNINKSGSNLPSESQKSRKRDSLYNQTVTSSDSDKHGHKRSVSMDIAEKTRVLRDIDSLINDLDVKIAHRMFNEAVTIIDTNLQEISDILKVSSAAISVAQSTPASSLAGGTINGRNPSQRPSVSSTYSGNQPPSTDIKALRAHILKLKLEQRSKEISEILLSNISQDYLSSGETKTQILLLINLNQAESAKKTFLNSRRQLILKRIKSVAFQGDIPVFISQVVTIHFRMIRTTADIYQSCFPSGEASSMLVEWAKNEVELYIVFFARQLYGISTDSDTYRVCIETTKDQAKQLKEVGLNLDFLLEYIYTGVPDLTSKNI